MRFVEQQRRVPQVAERHRLWAQQLMKHCGPGQVRLLDVGCGAGDFLACARQVGFEVCGLEISAPAARMAVDRWGIEVHLGEIADYRPRQPFDAITMIGLIEHVVDPRGMLEHACRLLRPGGVLFVYTPFWGAYDRFASALARMTLGRVTRPIDRRINPAHLQIFPPHTLLSLLRQLNLTILSCRRVCEYNLPIESYLDSIGLGQPCLKKVGTWVLQGLIDRGLFFRNNLKVFAAKRPA